jgi:Arc/MetJ-type ribon-helix-helix transcriptional regulator
MRVQISVRLSDEDAVALDAIVAAGRFSSRSDALRAALRLIVRSEREQAIDEAYRRGYGEKPQEDWISDLGAAAFAAFHQAEGGAPL